MKGAVASGHRLTSEAACEMLRKGGNAFDAVVAAAFAAAVTEPCLTSLGGGGFLMAFDASEKKANLYDFFVNAPGLGAVAHAEPHFVPINVCFKSTTQVFHTGLASVAVPGQIMGLIRCHEDLCTMDIDDIVSPAIGYLNEGVPTEGIQGPLMEMLAPILTSEPYGMEIYGSLSSCVYTNPLLRDFLSMRSTGGWLDTVYGSGADAIEAHMKNGGGMVTALDLRHYSVMVREPMSIGYRGFELLANCPPSFGGTLLGIALGQLQRVDMKSAGRAEAVLMLTQAMKAMNLHRAGAGGTTQISVIDEAGNAASMTSSNGSNSGCFLGETGIMLNNMMGEDDLHPGGFHTMEPGVRVGSMMCPAMIRDDGGVKAVLGSGGSKRIRTALLQAVHNLLDRGMPVAEAVEAPRIHLDDDGVLQVEPGFDDKELSLVDSHYKLNRWKERDLYFGGVHTVMGDHTGWGDTRRSGVFMRVQ